jgi:hypothetical protein
MLQNYIRLNWYERCMMSFLCVFSENIDYTDTNTSLWSTFNDAYGR